jgi:hypothetical protein
MRVVGAKQTRGLRVVEAKQTLGQTRRRHGDGSGPGQADAGTGTKTRVVRPSRRADRRGHEHREEVISARTWGRVGGRHHVGLVVNVEWRGKDSWLFFFFSCGYFLCFTFFFGW